MNSTKQTLLIIAAASLFLLAQTYASVSSGSVSDSLTKAIQIESAKSENSKWIYPAENLDPEKKFNPTLFVIKNKRGEFQSVFSETFAKIYSTLFYLVPIEFVPYFNIVFLILGMLSLTFIGQIPILVCILITYGSVLFSQSLDLSEVPLLFFLISISYSIWAIGIKKNHPNKIYLGLLLLLFGCFLRLEIILLGGLIFVYSAFYFYQQKSIKGELYLVASFCASIFIFFSINYINEGHIFGLRYLYNFDPDNQLTFVMRLKNMLNISFTSIHALDIKIGFFLYSPFFLYLIYFGFKSRSFETSNPSFAHLFILIVYPILVGITAPNDGITITGRYALAAIFPGMFLLSDHWNQIRGKKIFWLLVFASLTLSFFVLKVLKQSNKMIRKTNSILEPLKTDLWIFYDQNISGVAGLHLLKQPSLAVTEINWRKDLHTLTSRIKAEKIRNIVVFDFSESSIVKYKRPLELQSDDFQKLWKNEDFLCSETINVDFISYRKCNLL
ncbi:hypothetical protein JWG40_08355 [Leptospira sp. 201903074]|uniref:LA_3751/LA_3752 family putative glycosyltransferase n=1 Tax=Leptospira abararensis TaxID=2810036 RepID=UPI001963BA6E|nr:hypothetical protein [Leptospira abararensis]MBM9547026.1 hypothetical protein [Leptospira abararensis]